MNKIKTVWLAPIIGAAVATFACMAHADDLIVKKTLEKSSGIPGKRANASKGDTTFVSSPAAPAAASKDIGKVKIGVIKSLTLSGDVDFAEEQGVKVFLEERLVDGSEKTVGDLNAAISALRDEFSKGGFYLATVFPASADAYNPQTGDLALVVDPGRFGDVTVKLAEKDGPNWYSREQIEKRLKGLDGNAVFNYFKLRSALAALNGHPDLLANTQISLRDARGDEKADSPYTRFADVSLDVEDSFPLHLIWDVNNYGMRDIGEWQTSLTIQYLNLTRADDVLTVTPAMSFNSDLLSVSGSYMRPFDWLAGMNGTLFGGYSDLDSDNVLPSLALEGTGWFAGFNWSINLYDSDQRNFAFNAGLMYRYIEDEWSVASYRLKKREVGILPANVGFSYADKKGDWLGGRDFLNIGMTYNLASTEDNLDDYTEGAKKNYTLLRAGWHRLQPLFAESIPDDQKWRAWSLYSRVESQYSHDVLIATERLAYGGYNCLRGYRTRGYLGDTGVYGTLELRTPVLCDMAAGLFSDRTGKSPFDRLQFLVFSDLGWIKYNDPYPNMEADETLFSAGVGLRAGITKYTSLNFDLAFPLTKAYADEEDRDVEAYLSFKVIW